MLSDIEIKKIESNSWKGIQDHDTPISEIHEVFFNLSIKDIDITDLKILNLGGGYAREAEFLSQSGAKQIVILDIALGQLLSAKNRVEKHNLSNVFLINGDAESSPFKNKTFDLVYIFLAIHHFPNHERCLLQIFNVSKSFVFVDNMNHYITKFLNLFGLYKKEWCGIEPNRINDLEIRRLFETNGVKYRIYYYFCPPYYGNNPYVKKMIDFVSLTINKKISKSRFVQKTFGTMAIIRGHL